MYEHVVRRIAREHGVREATARRWLDECIRFLDLCAQAEEPLSPPKKIDRAWHEFVLHTRDYAEFCERRYGRFIHHDPSEAGDGGAGYRWAYTAAALSFSTLDGKIWPKPKDKRGGCTAGGGGCGSSGGDSGGDGGGSSCGGGCGGGGLSALTTRGRGACVAPSS